MHLPLLYIFCIIYSKSLIIYTTCNLNIDVVAAIWRKPVTVEGQGMP